MEEHGTHHQPHSMFQFAQSAVGQEGIAAKEGMQKKGLLQKGLLQKKGLLQNVASSTRERGHFQPIVARNPMPGTLRALHTLRYTRQNMPVAANWLEHLPRVSMPEQYSFSSLATQIAAEAVYRWHCRHGPVSVSARERRERGQRRREACSIRGGPRTDLASEDVACMP